MQKCSQCCAKSLTAAIRATSAPTGVAHWHGKARSDSCSPATETFDRHHSVISAMGDRYLLCRIAPVEGQFERALDHAGEATERMRRELSEVVERLFAVRRTEPRPLSLEERGRISRICSLVVRLRAAVDRHRYTTEIEVVHGAEGTGRLGLSLERLLAGLDTLGVDRDVALNVVETVAMDSTPPIRRRAYEYLRHIAPRRGGDSRHCRKRQDTGKDSAPAPGGLGGTGSRQTHPSGEARRVGL